MSFPDQSIGVLVGKISDQGIPLLVGHGFDKLTRANFDQGFVKAMAGVLCNHLLNPTKAFMKAMAGVLSSH